MGAGELPLFLSTPSCKTRSTRGWGSLSFALLCTPLEQSMPQKILWAEVLKETQRRKSRWTVRDLLVDGRCGQAVLDFLSSTDVGRPVPPLEEGDVGSEVSEWERREPEDEQEVGTVSFVLPFVFLL